MRLAKCALALASALLAGSCNQEGGLYPEQCSGLLPGWKKPSQGYSVLDMVQRVRLNPDSSIIWNGDKIDRDRLSKNMKLFSELTPLPFTVLEVSKGTPCADVQAVRIIIDQQINCREHPKCGEGAGPWAQVGDVVGPNGEPPEPFYPEPIMPSEGNEAR